MKLRYEINYKGKYSLTENYNFDNKSVIYNDNNDNSNNYNELF